MASYTMQLRTYIESFSQYDNLSEKEKIEVGREHLFDFDYPIFDPAYKKIFETNLIRRFYFREIGFETEGMFKFHLETWMLINMPYFNKMLESEMIEYDPLINSEMNVTHELKKDKKQDDERKSNQNVKSNTTGSSKGESVNYSNHRDFDRDITSDNPDTRLRITTGQDGTGVIEYASEIKEHVNVGKTDSKTNTANSGISDSTGDMTQDDEYLSKINELEDFVQHRKGKIGVVSYADLLTKYRTALLRVENMIHKEIQDLFMLVY